MKTLLSLFNLPLVWSIAATAVTLASTAYSQTPANRPAETPEAPVTAAGSRVVGGVLVYSINFPGGTAANFFELLRTNGFAGDNVLFAGRAANTGVPAFSVRNVRLEEIGKALEVVTADRLSVEVVPKGKDSDENFWRVKVAENAPPLKARTCALPILFSRPNAQKRIDQIIGTVDQVVAKQLDLVGRPYERGISHTIPTEKIVVVVGPEAYVEAVSSALEAAEKVATAGGS
jgi:hypothetical protein